MKGSTVLYYSSRPNSAHFYLLIFPHGKTFPLHVIMQACKRAIPQFIIKTYYDMNWIHITFWGYFTEYIVILKFI